MPKLATKTWDVFICHASEDKESFVEPLASALREYGVRVWYDKFALQLGDSLTRSIDRGSARSDYGLVVLSPAFFQKQWPEYELRGLTIREVASSKKILLPIWHNVAGEDIIKFSPSLADKLAIKTSGLRLHEIAIQVIEIVRPDIFTRIHRRIAYKLALKSAKIRSIQPKEVHSPPIRHEELPPNLISRIRLIRASLLGPYAHSMEFWESGFKRDAHPSQEITIWERIAAAYHEYLGMAPRLTRVQKESVFRILFHLSTTGNKDAILKEARGLPDETLKTLTDLYREERPPYDIAEGIPSEEHGSDELIAMFESMDKEEFPEDFPDELIEELVNGSQRKRNI